MFNNSIICRIYSIDNDTIKIKGKKIYYFDHEDENNEDKLR